MKMNFFFCFIVFFISTSAIEQPVHATGNNGTISVVSFDGMGYVDTQRYKNKGIMKNLEEVEAKSAYATDFVTVTPSLTAPSHAAMATGADPAKTGIVSNSFHSTGEKVQDDQSGFSQTLGVTPIWKEARNYGKVTATVAFPDSNPDNASAATYAVYSGGTLADSKLHKLKFKTIKDKRVEALSNGSKKVKEAVIHLQIKNVPSKQLYVLVTEDEEPLMYISTTREEIGQQVHEEDWIAVTLDLPDEESTGFYVKIKGDIQDLDNIELFQGTIMGSMYRGPDGFAESIASEFGFYPASDETDAFKDGDITREEYEQVSERFIDWVTDVSLYIKEQYAPDLLFYYYPHVDNELHNFLLLDPAQPEFTINTFNTNENYVRWAFQQADQVIGRINNSLQPDDHLFIVSDHGLEPIHTRLSPNKELEKAGLLVKDKNGEIDTSKTKAYAEASGTIAHVYVNVKGREKKGIVEIEEFESVKSQIVEVFKNPSIHSTVYSDPADAGIPALRWILGKSSFTYHYPSVAILSSRLRNSFHAYEDVWTKDMREYKKIASDNSGDVFLSAASGYLMGKDAKIAIEPTEELGSHGGDPTRSRLRPILYVAGPAIPIGELSKRISMIDIAPSIYELLSIPSPEFVEGSSIWK
ncbi:nucleotide pyrophosphatase [Sporosarcina sp. PTS2304]|uniref:alkaline phosphatase family protein n=1 Tax=Sporosarcina sp. PTS2304 TaxID=2283194 RepID=UPI000E0D80F9|nr:alkaline phosphatase family protein [Sporosarcina sp. PTS2304]AXH99984.1 nucleotide pyrophosphatase [Sporosarcina sp. PTS2304]